MTDLPAWAQESVNLKLTKAISLDDLSEDWVFGGATGRGCRVAVIDSGIDADHPGLGRCVDEAGGVEFMLDDAGTVISRPGPHADSFGHGTACAGIIHSLAPEAAITSVKVLGAQLSGKAAVFHAGLAWAIEQGFDVINLSLGARKREWAAPFHELCDRAYFGGQFVVTAANNVQLTSYPSLFASVASVACNLTDDPRRYHVNPRPPTEFLARGIDVPLLWLHHGIQTGTGNSYAAPHIAGLVALVRSKHPELRPFQVKTALWARAANVIEPNDPEIAGRLSRVMHASVIQRRTRAQPAILPPGGAWLRF